MLHNWYFCASLGLPVEDAANHQDIIAALGEPRGVDRAEELVCAALDCLLSAETAATLHALPHVLAAHRRFQGDPEVTGRALALYRTIARISPEHLQVRFAALLREAGGGEFEKAAGLLESALEEVLTRSHATAPGLVPYLDLGEQLAPTLVLIAGRFLASHRSQSMRERLGERPTVLVAALRGEHGRLALTQAAEWSATTWPEPADEVRALALASGGAFDMEPDLLMCAARVAFGILPEDHDPADRAALLDAVENEALSGTRLLSWVEEFTAAWDWRSADATARRQAAYTRLGGVAGHRDSAMPAVLWQNALTALAVELAPGDAVERLQHWWQPPQAFPETNQALQVQVSIRYTAPEYAHAILHVGRLLGLRTPPDGRRRPMPILTDGPVAETATAVAARVWSPWMLDRPGGAGGGASGASPADSEPEQLVRLLGAGLLAERLLTDGSRREGHPDFLLLLNIHVRDVLSRRYQKLMNAIREHTGRSLVPAGHLAGLMAHAQSMTDRVGKGLRPTVHPAEVVRVLDGLHARAASLPRGHALREMARMEYGLAAALSWVQESSAGGVGPHRSEAGARWFTGARPAADALFDLVSAQPGSTTRGTAITAALLRREIDEGDGEALFRWDWTPGGLPVPPVKNQGGKSVVPGHRELLLSGPTDPGRRDFGVEEWEVMGEELERRCEGSKRLRYVPLTARTLRLTALLGRPELGDERTYEDWVTQWTESVAALNSAAALPRVVRGRLLDMFRAQVVGAGSQERLSAVLERVVDVIIELSPRATLYYDRLFAEVGAGMSLPAESANVLRHRVLRAFYHQWGPSVFPAPRPEPFDTFGSRISARGTESALVDLVRATAHQELQATAVSLGSVMAEAWERAQQPARLGARREPMDALTLDPRLVVAATVDRRTGEAVLFPRREQLGMSDREGDPLPVLDLFSSGSDIPPDEVKGYVLGVVASVVHTRRETHLRINCGLPSLVSHTAPRPDHRWAMGRTLVANVLPGTGRATTVAALPVPTPCDGEVRTATLRATDSYPWLSLRVDGVGGDSYPTQSDERDISARRRWDPDLSRPFGTPAESWSTRTQTVWHAGYEHWVPLDAGLVELAAAASELPGSEGSDHARMRLVLCGRATDRSGFGAALRFALRPGRTYVLGRSAWEAEAWTALERACADAETGLVVHAEFPPGANRLRLVPGGSAIDRRNCDWQSVFSRSGAASEENERAGDQDLYEEALRGTGPDGRPAWRIEVPRIEGFPRWVVASEATTRQLKGRHTLCSVGSWGEPEARRAEVDVHPVDEIGIKLPATVDNFELLEQFEQDEVVEVLMLRRRDPAEGSNLVRTVDGICGFADTDSLTLTGRFPTGGTSRRWAIVTEDESRAGGRPGREPVPLPHEQLVAACVGRPDSAFFAGDTPSGMVAAWLTNAGREITRIRVWLRQGGRLVEAVLPVSCFDNAKPPAGSRLTVRRTAAGWTFAVHRRQLRLRGLWIREAAPKPDWTAVGVVTEDDKDLVLYQSPDRGRIALVPDTGDAPAAEGGVLAFEACDAEALKFRQPRNGRRAAVRIDGRTLVGGTSGVALPMALPTAVRLERTSLDLESIESWEDRPGGGRKPLHLVDVHREFVLSRTARAETAERLPVEATIDPATEWERIRASGVVTGQLTPDGRVLLPTGLAPDDAGAYQPWLAVLDEPQTLVGGRTYLVDRVRCVPVDSGRGARGSHLLVPPVPVAEFMAEVVPQARPNGKRWEIKAGGKASRRPFYVGLQSTPEGGVHRFEFGYGWFLDVPDQALTVGGKPVDPSGIALFHGDRVDAMSFGRRGRSAGAPDAITVDIAVTDIYKNTESQVRREAGKGVVHLLDLDLIHRRNRVAVHRVYTGSRRFAPGQEGIHVKEEAVSAYLRPEDVAALLAKFEPKHRRRKVLARLEMDPKGPPRWGLCFAVVPPCPEDENGAGLREGDSLYLEAGLASRSSNNFFLHFGLHPELEQPGEPLTAEVSRRDFSHRENCLRRAVETRADIYQGQAKMLVRLEQLYEGDRNRWRGSTKSPMVRTLNLLSSYLRTTGSDCFGVMAAKGESIEVRPGVLFPAADVHGADGVPAGSVVRLRRHGDGSVSARVAIPADATFLSDWPRPIVVFPKDILRTQRALGNADAHGNFTLAGLPGLNATAGRGTGAALLLTPHPKITGAVAAAGPRADAVRLTTLRAAAGGVIVLPPIGDAVAGARIQLLPIVGVKDERRTLDTEWARLSFMNGTAEEMARACRERYWRYHDELTRHWAEGADQPTRVRLPRQARAVEEPVFFSPHLTTWTLRHEPSALRRFGFPATELVENVRPNEAAVRTVWAVAWADQRSVWLETAPGRIVEVCAELVRFTDGSSLADLDWSFFSPGDMVYGRVQGGVNECGHLVLETWRPGVRGSLGRDLGQRMLLPVEHADEINGALLLGAGADVFPYPADRKVLDRHRTDKAVWLNRSNELTSLKDSPVAAGDVVFLSPAAGGGLAVLGLPQARVIVAGPAEREWPGCDWLREELVAANRKGALPAGLTGVPVTVLHVDQGRPATLTVSRRAQPGGTAAGSVLVQPVAELGGGRIAVRSGSALFRVHMSDLLPGLPEDVAAAAAKAFVGDGATIRLHWDERTRSLTGRPADGTDPDDSTTGSDEQGETIVQPWLSVNDTDGNCRGLVCRDERSHRLCWLAAENAAWTADLPGDVLLEHLRGLRRVAVLRTGSATVTFTGHSMNVREYDNLAPGQRRRVTVVDPRLPTAADGTAESSHRCLVSVEPVGMLAVHTLSEGAAPPAIGESRFSEVSRIGGPGGRRLLSLVEPGSRLTVLDLPAWTTDALSRLFRSEPWNGRPRPVDGLVDARFRDYWASYEQGLAGYGAVAKDVPEPRAEANRVLRALGTYDAEQPVTAADRAEAVGAVGSWLRSPEGRAVVLQQNAEVDLAPLLAVCRLGGRLGERKVGLPPGWLAYLLGRLGDRAVSSLHTEALVTQWITKRERHTSRLGRWQRLRTVEFAPTLTPNQVTAVLDFGKAVTGHPGQNHQESDAAPVARSLLAAVGALPAAEELVDTARRPRGLLHDAPILRGLAELGAGLRPARGEAAPRWELLPQQVAALRGAADKVMREDTIALTLLPAYAPLAEGMGEYAADLLSAAARLRG